MTWTDEVNLFRKKVGPFLLEIRVGSLIKAEIWCGGNIIESSNSTSVGVAKKRLEQVIKRIFKQMQEDLWI